MRIYEWELLAVCHHPEKFGDHRHCDNEGMFSICHVALHDHMFKWLCKVEGPHSKAPLCYVWWPFV